MKVQCIVFGKTASPSVSKLVDEYISRIQPFSEIDFIVLPEEKMAKTVSSDQIKTREAERFWKVYTANSFLVACDVKGKFFSSEQLSEKIGKIQNNYASLTFVVGGSLGLSNDIIQKSDLRLSFSAMTFPHDLFRVFLLEQIYRSYMILGNRKYHR